MARSEPPYADSNDEEADDEPDKAVLQAQLDVLEAENERLRSEYIRARQSSYRRTALGLGVLGTGAVLAAIIFTSVRDVLLTLGAIGLFGAVLTYYLTPERFVAADVGERVYSALATNEQALADELGLSPTRVYVPVDDADARVRLYIPHREQDTLPEDLTSLFVVTEDARGVALTPSGEPLFTEFERTLSGSLADDPTELTTQLTESLQNTFEVVDATEIDVDAVDGRASIQVTGPAYPDADAFDNPIVSFLAVGYAIGFETPVTVEVHEDNGGDGFNVTCRWTAEEETATEKD